MADQELDILFKAIADPTRRRILDVLRSTSLPANSLVERFIYRQPTISEHLRILREAGLVAMESRGRQRIYSIAPGKLYQIADWALQLANSPHTAMTASPIRKAEPISHPTTPTAPPLAASPPMTMEID